MSLRVVTRQKSKLVGPERVDYHPSPHFAHTENRRNRQVGFAKRHGLAGRSVRPALPAVRLSGTPATDAVVNVMALWQDVTVMAASTSAGAVLAGSFQWRNADSVLWTMRSRTPVPALYRRYLKFKANIESGSSYFNFKSLVPGAFNMGFIGSTCTALPRS